MDKSFYDFRILDDAFRYEFVSVGLRTIPKVIIYQETDIADFYNLVLADILDNGTIETDIESKNGDLEKIIATVFRTTITFWGYYPDAKIAFTGSDSKRTRLYQIILTKELDKISHLFAIFGLNDEGLVLFEPNQRYNGFVVYKK
jgi:hypothetical protein